MNTVIPLCAFVFGLSRKGITLPSGTVDRRCISQRGRSEYHESKWVPYRERELSFQVSTWVSRQGARLDAAVRPLVTDSDDKQQARKKALAPSVVHLSPRSETSIRVR